MLGLVALLMGAITAGSVSVAAEATGPPQVTDGSPVPDVFALAALAESPWMPGAPSGSDAAGRPLGSAAQAGQPAQPVQPPAPAPTTTTEAPPTTTEPPPPPPPAPTTTQPPAPTTTAPPAGQTDQVVALVNEERAGAGCPAVTVDARLIAAAQGHSSDMAANGYFSHTSQDGRTFADRIRAAGYPSPAAENIAAGQRSARQVMQAWMNSSGHRANILNCGIRTIGVGLDTRGWYWTQNFGR